MSLLKPYLYCALFLLLMLLLSRIAVKICCFFTKLRFRTDGKATPSSIAAYMICRYGENAVITGSYFQNALGRYERVPLVVVMKSGIAVIEARNVSGSITPMGEAWRMARTDRYGETESADFPDPIEESRAHAAAIASLFRGAGFPIVPRVIPVAVMPLMRCRFRGALPKDVIDLSEIERFLKEADSARPFSEKERAAVISFLEHRAKHRRQLPTR